MKQSVYIETSFFSYLTSRPSNSLLVAARQAVTYKWWEKHRRKFDLYSSVVVVREAGRGNPEAARNRLQAMAELPVFDVTDEASDLAGRLIRGVPFPSKAEDDAVHIAVAAVNGMDYLLTWNFKHMNNAGMKRRVVMVVEESGYRCPILCSPEELGEM